MKLETVSTTAAISPFFCSFLAPDFRPAEPDAPLLRAAADRLAEELGFVAVPLPDLLRVADLLPELLDRLELPADKALAFDVDLPAFDELDEREDFEPEVD